MSVAAHRRGEPSPLVFHIAAAIAAYQHALLAAPKATDPRFPWSSPDLRAAAAELEDLDAVGVAAEVGRRLAAMQRGLELWQAHPYRRRLAPPPAIWQRGAARLLDYGQVEGAVRDGPAVLVVPSLINRAYILDLLPGRSLLRWLAGQGLRPVLLDWGEPAAEERRFDLAAYGAERLLPAVERLAAEEGRPVGVFGYCMGGTLAAGLAARAPERMAALVTVGAPWDFGGSRGIAGSLRAMLRAGEADRVAAVIDGLGEAFGAVPDLVFQQLFALVNPIQASVKFQRFARLDQGSAAATHFVALEDWLTDGVPMAAGAARDLLVDWQVRNVTARGRWRFLGGTVRAEAIRLPTLAVCGRSDSIAPPPLARALPAAIPGAQVAMPPTGHVGMIVGSAAPAQVWRPLADFLRAHVG